MTVPVPVDGEGLDVAAGERRAPNARVAFVTPSRQLPLGVRMSRERRMQLLDWARRAKAWVIEDDRDSEFRYSSRPVGSLQGMDAEGCVLYMGTFSKAMFPALRLGYLVVPDRVRDAFIAARHFADLHQSYVEQAAMAEFMRDGHFERHVRHVRNTYLQRQQHLVAEAHRYLGGRLTVEPADAGMEVIAWLHAKDNDVAVTETIRREGVDVVPLSPIVMERRLRPGLILGYSGLGSREITEGIQCIARAMERYKGVV
jgi:GntR family transcriptional regulator/MocR family aminotransferase